MKDLLESELRALRQSLEEMTPEDAWRRFAWIEARIVACIDPLKTALLDSLLEWTAAQRAECAWIRAQHLRLGSCARRLAAVFERHSGAGDGRTLQLVAASLQHRGDALKWEIALGHYLANDPRKLHDLMSIALRAGKQAISVPIASTGARTSASIESLYFRALLLARATTGTLNCRQVEILDSWIQIWLPLLKGTGEAPEGLALQVDLDSTRGLRPGSSTPAPGRPWYLPLGPLEVAFTAIITEFHAGRVVPAHGLAARLPVTDHVAVIAAVRRTFAEVRDGAAEQSVRLRSGRWVIAHLGLGEIVSKAFQPASPTAGALSLVPDASSATIRRRDRPADGFDEVYEPIRRRMQIVDSSDTGFGLEGSSEDCANVAVGDLMALRLSAEQPRVLCHVVRCMPSSNRGTVLVGVRKLTAQPQLMRVVRVNAPSIDASELTLIYIPGDESSGRHDAFVVGDALLDLRALMEADVGGEIFSFRLNRVRHKGRGWSLAGFEMLATRSSAIEFLIA